MKTIKHILATALMMAFVSFSNAQVSVTGNVLDNGNPVVGILVNLVWDTGADSVLTDATGQYTYSINSAAGQGAVTATIVDCNGYNISETGGWYPGSTTVSIADIQYCASSSFVVSLDVAFNNASSAVAFDLSWDNGTTFSSLNTNSSGSYSTTYTATSAGTMILNYTDCNGVSHSLTDNYSFTNDYLAFTNEDYCPTTPPACQAMFYLNQAQDSMQNPLPNQIVVTDFSTGSGLTYTWDFGDGSPTYTGTNFNHVYASAGDYILCLTIDNGNGCTDTYCDSLNVGANGMLGGKSDGSFTLIMGNGDNNTITASISENSKDLGVSIYPNPANSFVNVTINSSINGVANVNVVDLSGKIVYNSTIGLVSGEQTLNIDLSNLNKGMYMVIVNSDTQNYNTKLVIK